MLQGTEQGHMPMRSPLNVAVLKLPASKVANSGLRQLREEAKTRDWQMKLNKVLSGASQYTMGLGPSLPEECH